MVQKKMDYFNNVSLTGFGGCVNKTNIFTLVIKHLYVHKAGDRSKEGTSLKGLSPPGFAGPCTPPDELLLLKQPSIGSNQRMLGTL